MTLNVNQEIKGYQIIDRIGAGGFGAVYRANQSTVGREVAIKVILPGYANQPEFIQRFETEAQIIAKIEHLHIVPLYDYWRDPDGAYIVMRLLRGGSLKDALTRSGPLELEEAVLLIEQVSMALSAVHRYNIIHRDIKPSNVLLDEDGNAYLSDFGIAKDLQLPSDGKTEANGLVGSPEYLSPEQARSEPVTPQTDIYSLGVLLYEVLCGTHPFEGSTTIDLLYKHINEPLPTISVFDPEVNKSVNQVIQKASQKKPADRFEDVMKMAAEFREAAGLGISRASLNLVELLTPREQQVLRAIIDGRTNREIAELLVIELATVKWYVKNIYRKLNVRSRVQAIVKARELNLVVDDFDVDTVKTLGSSSLLEPNNPYKGLLPFDISDEQDFFGREKMVSKLLSRLSGGEEYNRFLAIIGPSGSGKSSLVKAGLIPALWRGEMKDSEKWFVVDISPGSRPIDELEVGLTRISAEQGVNIGEHLNRDQNGLLRAAELVLPKSESELLVVIDQFEEVFTLVEDDSYRKQFLDLITAAVTNKKSRVRIVITLRADFYDRPLQYPVFADLLQNRIETVLPLSAEELERAIVRPASQVGVEFEDGLVPAIIDDVLYQPGGLPLLQYALSELFEIREGLTLTHAGYEQIGGAVGALGKRAEELYQELNDLDKQQCRQMFLRLATIGEGSDGTRRVVKQSELMAAALKPESLEEIIETFSLYRLLSLDTNPETRSPTVEVAHEAILGEWKRLKTWLNESQVDIRLQQQLAGFVQEWEQSDGDESFLLRGSRLEQFEGWRDTSQLSLTPSENEFLDASVHLRAQKESEEIERKEREQHLQKRVRLGLQALAIVMFIATIVSGTLAIRANRFSLAAQDSAFAAATQAAVAEEKSQLAETERERAELEAAQSQSMSLSMAAQQAASIGDTNLALTLIREAMTVSNPDDAVLQRFYQLVKIPGINGVFSGHEHEVTAGYLIPDSNLAITGDSTGQIIIWDTITGSIQHTYRLHESTIEKIIFLGKSGDIISASSDGKILIWNPDSGSIVVEFDSSNPLTDIAVSSSESVITSSYLDGRIALWDIVTGEMIESIRQPDELEIQAIAIFSDDQRIAYSAGGAVTVLDIVNGSKSAEINTSDSGSIFSLAVNPVNDKLLIGNEVGILTEWDPESNTTVQLPFHDSAILSLAYHPEGTRAISTDKNGKVVIWDLVTRQVEALFDDHIGFVYHAAFSQNGNQAITVGEDARAIVWDIHFTNWDAEFIGHKGWVLDTAVSPDGTQILSGGGGLHPGKGSVLDNSVILWDAVSGEVLRHFLGHSDEVTAVEFGPHDRTIVSGSKDGSVIKWDQSSGVLIDELNLGSPVIALEVFGDVVIIGVEGSSEIFIWKNDGDLTILELDIRGSKSLAVASTIGKLVVGDAAGTIKVVDLDNFEVIQTINTHQGAILSIDISPLGEKIAAGSIDQAVTVWSVETGAMVFNLEVPDQDVWDVMFTDNGRFLLSGHGSKSQGFGVQGNLPADFVMWDMHTGEKLQQLAGHEGIVTSVSTSDDIPWVITGSSDGTIKKWLISPKGTLNWLDEHRMIQPLSCDQQKTYLVGIDCQELPEIPKDTLGSQLDPGLSFQSDSYRVGLVEDITTLNVWAAGGKEVSFQNSWVLIQSDTVSMFKLAPRTQQLVPWVAEEMPEPSYDSEGRWIVDVIIRDDVMWSDGENLTAEDIAFTATTALLLELEQHWGQMYSNGVLEAVEVIDTYRVRFIYSSFPGFDNYQNMLVGYILPEHFWGSIVDETIAALINLPDTATPEEVLEAQTEAREILYAIQPQGEPRAGAYLIEERIPGILIRARQNPQYFLTGTTIRQYQDGTYEQYDKDGKLRHQLYGSAMSEVVDSYEIGPHFESLEYQIYSTPEDSIDALMRGEVDFLLYALSLPFQSIDRLEGFEGVSVLKNQVNGYFYLAYNANRMPMSDLAFRQAIAALIDNQLLSKAVLPGAGYPSYSFVAEGNDAWFNPLQGTALGEGLDRSSRLSLAVDILENAGYSWENGQKPAWDVSTELPITPGRLIMPDGQPAPALEIDSVWGYYDVVYPSWATWIVTWIQDIGVPVEVHLQDQPELYGTVFSNDFDFYLLGWSLDVFPGYLHGFFSCSNEIGFNLTGFCDDEYQKVAEQFLSCQNYDECKTLADELQVLLLDLQPYTILPARYNFEAYRSDRIDIPITQSLSGLKNSIIWKELVKPVE